MDPFAVNMNHASQDTNLASLEQRSPTTLLAFATVRHLQSLEKCVLNCHRTHSKKSLRRKAAVQMNLGSFKILDRLEQWVRPSDPLRAETLRLG